MTERKMETVNQLRHKQGLPPLAGPIGDTAIPEGIMKWFRYEHLPEKLQEVSQKFCALAWAMMKMPYSVEREECLRKLLEAKDCAVRARLEDPKQDRPTNRDQDPSKGFSIGATAAKPSNGAVIATILKAGHFGPSGTILTEEALPGLLRSVQDMNNVLRAWIEGDEIKAEMDLIGP